MNPELPPPFITDAVDRLSKRLWYLYQDSGLNYFDARANLNRILVDREEMVRSEPEKVKEFARSQLNDLIGYANVSGGHMDLDLYAFVVSTVRSLVTFAEIFEQAHSMISLPKYQGP